MKIIKYNQVNAAAMTTSAPVNTPGQMAQNFFEPLKAEVNNRTGCLGITFQPPKLIGRTLMDLNLGITYYQSTVASDTTLFGLPNGWSYFFSYIIDYNIVINGSDRYQLDEDAESGMKNYKQKNFTLLYESTLLPYSYNGSSTKYYTYCLNFQDGHNQYFDSYGKLICYDDKWGNHQMFYYDQENKNIAKSKLIEVITSEGKSVTLTYENKRILIAYPTGGQNTIKFSYTLKDSKIGGYIDPNEDETEIEYESGNYTNKKLISKISYLSGLTSKYTYIGLEYKNGSSNAYLDVVSKVSRKFGGVTRTVKYKYKSDTSNHNYLGFPTFSVQNGNDPLFQSDGQGSANSYRYSTIVNNGITEATHNYN